MNLLVSWIAVSSSVRSPVARAPTRNWLARTWLADVRQDEENLDRRRVSHLVRVTISVLGVSLDMIAGGLECDKRLGR